METLLRVKLAETEHEWEETRKLIDLKYESKWGIVPPPATRHIIVVEEQEVIATVGVEFAQDGAIPLEHYFDIRDEAFARLSRETIVEWNRWASKHPRAGQVVSLGAATYALLEGKSHVAFYMKEAQLKYLQALGAQFSILPSSVREENIPIHIRDYYTKPPFPQVALADIEQLRDVFLQATHRLESKGIRVIIDF